ncbi:MAG: pesticidal protein Cry15Aa [Anaerolineae bacterium]|nr:pesticidal protein Cry15Aa [Anaerolineae bacterium]
MRIVKRYPNRKLYDTEAKAYVTLEGIAELIRAGADIQVVDHETGEDLTTVTLSQIILEQEKRQGTGLPKQVLTSLIRTGGDTFDIFRRSFYSSLGAMRTLEEGIERRIDVLVRRGQMSEDEGRRLRESLLSRARALDADTPDTATSGDEGGLDSLKLPTRADIQRLTTQLEELTAKLDSILSLEAQTDEAADPSVEPPAHP